MRKALTAAKKRLRTAVRYRTDFDEYAFASLQPDGSTPIGTALLSYVVEPFLKRRGEPIDHGHTHHGESLQMARTFLDLGYAVDVISYRNSTFRPRKPYDLFVGARVNFERLASLLPGDCIKIAHLDTAHWLFNNTAVHRRHLELLQRRDVALPFRRKQVEPNWAIEAADYATVLGNDFTLGTYAYAGTPMFPLPVPSSRTFPAPEGKDFDAVRRTFVWFGSEGLTHKGLDLVLEAFAQMPEYRLTVCGPIARDESFQRAFQRELYETPNIRTAQWVDIEGPEFAGITRNALGVVYPSASEGQAGAVVTCLHAGLIPLVSFETGVDVDGFGVLLEDTTVEGVKRAVRSLAAEPSGRLAARAFDAWRTARATYTRERYAATMRQVIQTVTAPADARGAAAATGRDATPPGVESYGRTG